MTDNNQVTNNTIEIKVEYLGSRTKRLLDILGGLVGLLVGLPIFLFASIIVKFIDDVPSLFRQERIGYRGGSFHILKLRTLKVIESRETVDKNRIERKPNYETTRTGQFWRTTSIDEIIQFWLVVIGEMRLIGHRPIPVYYLPHLSTLKGINDDYVKNYFETIKEVKPGMSSLSSVNGRGNLTVQEKLAHDIQYAQKASLLFDLVLILKTIRVVLLCKGAK